MSNSPIVNQVENCHALSKINVVCASIGVSCGTLLFFFRVKAVFHHSRGIIYAFFVFWVIQNLSNIADLFAVDSTHIGSTKYCINTPLKAFDSTSVAVQALYDTSIWLVISTRLSMFTPSQSPADRFRAFASGHGIGHVSRILLQTSQLCYLASACVHILSLTALLSPTWSPVARIVCTTPDVVVQNIASCRAYRALSLQLVQEPEEFSLDISRESDDLAFADSDVELQGI